MTTILIDTSIIIDYLRQKEKDTSILPSLLEKKYHLAASILTHTEVYAGKSIWEKEEAKNAIKIIFSQIKILPVDEAISEKAGKIRAKHGTDIVDAIIAATAISHKLTL